MANPVSISDYHQDTGGIAYIYGSASVSYTRSGNKVTVTVTVTVTSGKGKYYGVQIDGTGVISEKTGTVTKTYTYDDADAKTYSYSVSTYIQTATSYAGYSKTHGTLTIDVPAAGGQVYTKVGGVWKKDDENYVEISGAPKKSIVKAKVEGAWK